MFLLVAILVWSAVIGWRARRLGPRESVQLLVGIAVAVVVQYYAFGPK